MSKVLPFKYHGSKWTHFDFISSKLPRTHQYIEPYGGAGTVLLNRDPVPVETFNDLLGDIPHFFRVLREREEELLDALARTPYSREEYARAVKRRAEGYPDCSDVERARLFYITVQQGRTMSQHRMESGDVSDSNWSYAVISKYGRMTDNTTSTWRKRHQETLPQVADRLAEVQIESRPALEVIETHDRDTATFYVDPPYPHLSRGDSTNYAMEMDESDHRELFEVLDQCDGHVAVSGYANDLYDSLYDEWNSYAAGEKAAAGGSSDGTRQEMLWTNYDADELGGAKIGEWPEPDGTAEQLTLTEVSS